jgi:DNA-binding MarR family transcriptional regulator
MNFTAAEAIQEYQRIASDLFKAHSPESDSTAPVAVWRLVRAAGLAEKALDTEVHRPRNRSSSAYRVLWTLNLLGPIDPGTLARLMDVAPPSISSLLASLERANLVTREPDPLNRRRVIVKITESGSAAAKESLDSQVAAQQRFVECLTVEEQTSLGAILGKLLDFHWLEQGKDFRTPLEFGAAIQSA